MRKNSVFLLTLFGKFDFRLNNFLCLWLPESCKLVINFSLEMWYIRSSNKWNFSAQSWKKIWKALFKKPWSNTWSNFLMLTMNSRKILLQTVLSQWKNKRSQGLLNICLFSQAQNQSEFIFTTYLYKKVRLEKEARCFWAFKKPFYINVV